MCSLRSRNADSLGSRDQLPLCRDCRADRSDPTSIETATPPPPVRVSQPFLLTQVIVGINVLVFVGMVLSGVSPWRRRQCNW